MAKVATIPVTVRLNKMHLATVDALVETGQIRNRTHAIAEALRDWVNRKASEVPQLAANAKAQVELQTMAAQMSQLQAQLNKLQKK
jgi:Arc/MetJ-type ribon-helix-helix transcriptional regulator